MLNSEKFHTDTTPLSLLEITHNWIIKQTNKEDPSEKKNKKHTYSQHLKHFETKMKALID